MNQNDVRFIEYFKKPQELIIPIHLISQFPEYDIKDESDVYISFDVKSQDGLQQLCPCINFQNVKHATRSIYFNSDNILPFYNKSKLFSGLIDKSKKFNIQNIDVLWMFDIQKIKIKSYFITSKN